MKTYLLLVPVLLTAAPASTMATAISPGAFSDSAVIESFEGWTAGPNLDEHPFDKAFLYPGTDTVFTFSSGVMLTAPIPNGDALIGDFALGDGRWFLTPNGVVSAEYVPNGSAYIGWNNDGWNTERKGPTFTFATDMHRVGIYATSAGDAVTLRAFDSDGVEIESLTISSVDASQWSSNFLGIQNISGIRSIQVEGEYTAMDGLIFEAVSFAEFGLERSVDLQNWESVPFTPDLLTKEGKFRFPTEENSEFFRLQIAR